jgi:hypothetical protein
MACAMPIPQVRRRGIWILIQDNSPPGLDDQDSRKDPTTNSQQLTPPHSLRQRL